MSNVVLPFPYSLPMPRKVKKKRDRTRVSSKHQVTIPAGAFHAAGLATGDTLRVEAAGTGRVVLTRVDELLDRFTGCVDSGGALRASVEGLRDEWR
jgi:bifunctional DNA-binding transcriptional regulator/antitoxin component of YhaV-PrlF toxin-antitoxin module